MKNGTGHYAMFKTRLLLVFVGLFFAIAIATSSSSSSVFVSAVDEAAPKVKGEGDEERREGSPEDPATTKQQQPPPPKKEEEEEKDDFDPKSHFEWGHYYDPKNIFCGKYDCYGILGFDYESFDKVKPSRKRITKRYRSLSRLWHPDKSKHKEAKERFVKIARAYEVLTNAETRKEYDSMRYDQEAYYQKYGSTVTFSFAPKSDTVLVLLLVLSAVNGFVYFAQYNKWKKVCERLAKAAVHDWNPSQGGTPESKELRERALELMKEDKKKKGNNEKGEEEKQNGVGGADASSKGNTKKANGATGKSISNSTKSGGGKNSGKLTTKEKKEMEATELRPYCEKLAFEITDFGAGFHKPTWKDLPIVTFVTTVPYSVAKTTAWQTKFWFRRYVQKLPLSDEEKRVLTERAVGYVHWEFADEQTRENWTKRELYVTSNLAEWQEEQEMSKMSKTERKRYESWKKNN